MLALADPAHVHHNEAHGWFRGVESRLWATCPLVENGFVRIASHPQYPNSPGDTQVALGLLRRMCASPEHEFWPDEVSLREVIASSTVLTHRQVGDLYLLACQSAGVENWRHLTARFPPPR
ncbi:MAG: VapC toxin family PIN domain ribonuclease [Vulcanimicrobiota bacterium]